MAERALRWETGSLAFILDLLFCLRSPVWAVASEALHLSWFVLTKDQGPYVHGILEGLP